jgi:N-succinyldiaminopimelate aminotransferase
VATRLPEEAGVVAIPLSAFCAAPTPETGALLRFAFCKRPEVLDDASARLQEWAMRR